MQSHEEQIIGILLHENFKAFDIKCRPKHFDNSRLAFIYSCILELVDQGIKADLVTLKDILEKKDKSEYIAIAVNATSIAISANWKYFDDNIIEDHKRRMLYKLSIELKQRTDIETRFNSDKTLAFIDEAVLGLFDDFKDYQKLSNYVPGLMEKIENVYHSKTGLMGLDTGYSELNALTSGFQNQDLIIIGARPSIGKTVFAINLANRMERNGAIVGFISAEMSAERIAMRFLTLEGNIDSKRIQSGFLKTSDFSSISDAAEKLYNKNIYIDDSPNIQLERLKQQARKMKHKDKIDILFVDYITLIINSEKSRLPRHEQVADISRQLKILARELNIPVVALSQVRRDSHGKKPTMADLRASGDIEQDADLILLLHRSNAPGVAIDTLYIDLVKQRNGPTGEMIASLLMGSGRIVEQDRDRKGESSF